MLELTVQRTTTNRDLFMVQWSDEFDVEPQDTFLMSREELTRTVAQATEELARS